MNDVMFFIVIVFCVVIIAIINIWNTKKSSEESFKRGHAKGYADAIEDMNETNKMVKREQ